MFLLCIECLNKLIQSLFGYSEVSLIKVGVERVIWLKFHIAVHHQRNSGQELKESRIAEERADAEALESIAFWSAPHGLLDLLSCRTQDHSFTQGLSHPPWAIHFPTNN